MTALHEAGEAWHVGWDWHAGMWYVEPPFDVELEEPMLWFNERHEAFEFVDDQIRSQPVRASIVDEMERLNRNPETLAVLERAEQHIEDAVPLEVIRHEDNPFLPRYQVSDRPVVANTGKAANRVAEYAERVGLK